MLDRHLKLKLTKVQETKVLEWLNNLTGVYNWGIRKVKLNALNKIYFSKYTFQNLLANHSRKLEIPSHTISGTLLQAFDAWKRFFTKVSGEPTLKGRRNKFNSIPFPDPIEKVKKDKIFIPGLSWVKFYKQQIPTGLIKNARLIKRASGWYLIITIDNNPVITKVKDTDSKVGCDTGFKDLLVLSDGMKYKNPRELRTGAIRLAQAQRGGNKKLAARLQEHQANRRKDRNHKIALDIVRNHKEIYVTNDNLKGQRSLFGKSVQEAGISQLRKFISYKSSSCGRKFTLVDSRYTTMTCSICGSRSGPTGLRKLDVREWVCIVCGTHHDRDINAARIILISGSGLDLSLWCNAGVKPKSSVLEEDHRTCPMDSINKKEEVPVLNGTPSS